MCEAREDIIRERATFPPAREGGGSPSSSGIRSCAGVKAGTEVIPRRRCRAVRGTNLPFSQAIRL